jgi:F-type H+-transporting ATPase subunit epsilon
MTTLKEGRVKAYDGDATMVFEVRGGFADVNAEGLIILAEYAQEVI